MRSVLLRSGALLVAIALLATACAGPAAQPSPTRSPTPPPEPEMPTFESGSYQAQIQARGTLKVGTREDNVPFGRKDPATNRFEGFDVDTAREIAKAIFGSEAEADPDAFIEYVPVVSATRIPTLQEDQADLIIATFTINAERKEQIDFSSVYFRTGQRILVRADNTDINSVADLAGKTVCTARGSTSEKNIAEKAPDAQPLLLDSYPPCLLALQQGSADAVSTDETILFGLALQDPNTKLVGPYFSDEPYGIGVKKERPEFVVFINSVIADMIADGRWAEFYEEHITPVSGDIKEGPHDRGQPAN